MLSAGKRLVEKKDFAGVQRYGKRFLEDNLQLQFLEDGRSSTKIGFIVGAKFSKKAVERNALKRKLREIFKRELKNIKSGADIIVSVKGKADGKETYKTLRKTVGELLRKSKLLIKKD